MSSSIRIALPGYDPLTDTNLDHYSLYTDEDNVLIKRYSTGTGTIDTVPPSPETVTIAHTLDYVPFFMSYYDQYANGWWSILNNRYNPFEAPANLAAITSSNLKIYNYQARDVDYAYDIFYDNMDTSGTPSITESSSVIKLARPGKSISSTSPNDYIMHSDLNNFKILKSGTTSLSIQTVGLDDASFNHGADVDLPYKYFIFIKFPDGKVAQVGGSAETHSYDDSVIVYSTYMDSSKIYIASPDTDTVDVSYFIYGTGKDNTLATDSAILMVAKDGQSVNSTNPDDFNFHSSYPTLKYYLSGTYSMTVTDTTVQTIPHNLGYTPFFIGFVNDLQGLVDANAYAISPYYLNQSIVPLPDRDIAAFVYADDTNLYLKAYYQTNAVGTSKTFNFRYKIFKNDLGL